MLFLLFNDSVFQTVLNIYGAVIVVRGCWLCNMQMFVWFYSIIGRIHGAVDSYTILIKPARTIFPCFSKLNVIFEVCFFMKTCSTTCNRWPREIRTVLFYFSLRISFKMLSLCKKKIWQSFWMKGNYWATPEPSRDCNLDRSSRVLQKGTGAILAGE